MFEQTRFWLSQTEETTWDAEFCIRRAIEALLDELEPKGQITCPDNPGGRHRWNGDGQCLDCSNYATDLIDKHTQEAA